MYAAKQGGRNRYSYFTPDLQLAAQARQQVTLDLRSALALEQFELHYQPIVNCRAAASSGPKPCCAGAIRSAACWRRPNSCRLPKPAA
jgi:predicted signal transduction protein with EAL and GGDEF domain